jgi:hypothetical protein
MPVVIASPWFPPAWHALKAAAQRPGPLRPSFPPTTYTPPQEPPTVTPDPDSIEKQALDEAAAQVAALAEFLRSLPGYMGDSAGVVIYLPLNVKCNIQPEACGGEWF